MPDTAYLKCACGNCGEVIDYLPGAAGQTVECPNCKEKSQLPQDSKTESIESPAPELAPPSKCPACGALLNTSDKPDICAACAGRRRKIKAAWALASAFVLFAAAALFIMALNRPAPKARALVTPNLPQPKSAKSMADLKIGKFYLQRNQGSNLILAVGKVENISNNVHFGVKVDLDILDVTGAKIGMVSDVIRELKPHAPWEFLATVSNLKAASVCFASIKEDR